ncbi:MAG: FHA domain-containing protein [Myxococcales bacterium]|nr:FHA domain-containing protein [Myxococcales bacterium]
MLARAFTTSTRTAKNAAWDITDEIVAFRFWGEGATFYFRAGVGDEWQIGSSSQAQLRIKDADGVISRRHATMKRLANQWQIIDHGSKNGLAVDGVRRDSATLDPGSVVALGSVRLVAMSCRLMALREFLLRIMGRDAEAQVDETLQDIRIARARRDPLVLRGPGNLVELARQLAALLLEKGAPFALYDTCRDPVREGDVRRWPNATSLRAAIEEGRRGAVCVRSRQLPAGFVAEMLALRMSPGTAPLVIVCDVGVMALDGFRMAPPIAVQSFEHRPDDELAALVAASLAEVAREWSTDASLSPEEYRWILANAETVDEVATCVRRLLARRSSRSTMAAARLLGIAAVSLRRWFKRHPPPKSAGRVRR